MIVLSFWAISSCIRTLVSPKKAAIETVFAPINQKAQGNKLNSLTNFASNGNSFFQFRVKRAAVSWTNFRYVSNVTLFFMSYVKSYDIPYQKRENLLSMTVVYLISERDIFLSITLTKNCIAFISRMNSFVARDQNAWSLEWDRYGIFTKWKVTS